jgi:hypothetical protein
MIEKGFIDLGCEVVRLCIDKDEPEWILITVCQEAWNWETQLSDDVADSILIAELEEINNA